MRETAQRSEDGIDYQAIAPRDVVGFHVFHADRGMGLGKVEAMTRIRGRAHFVCDSGGSTVNRPVDEVMTNLREHGYDLCHEPWDVARADEIDETGVDEAEIQERAQESWTRLADEFGLTEDQIQAIIMDDS